FRAQATELLGVALGYQNSWYDYRQDGAGSRSALLDRLEHLFRVDARWQALPSLVGLVGYEFGINNYTADEPLTTALNALTSKARDNRAQYFYVAADYTVSERMNTSARVGIRYTDYTEIHNTDWSPYAEISSTYTY